MTNIKYSLNDLFFKDIHPRLYTSKYELDKPVDFDRFYIIMIDSCCICSDSKFLNRERLKLLYDAYIKTFNDNKSEFRKLKLEKRSIKSDAVFKELLPSTKVTTNLAYYVNRCYNNAIEMLKNRQTTISLQSFIDKYGENEGNLRYEKYLTKWKKTYHSKGEEFKKRCKKLMLQNFKTNKEYYQNKINPDTGKEYTDNEITESIKKWKRKYSLKSAETRKKRNEEHHDVSVRQINYWLNKGYTYEKAADTVRKIQATNTVERYIKKYGYKMGYEEWCKRNNKWGERMRELKLKSCSTGNAYSKAACTLFDTVIKRLSEEGYNFKKVYYGKNEFYKWDKEYSRVYFYDFIIDDIKLCVEYNGIMFHPKEGDTEWKGLFSGKTYQESIEYDKRKQKCIQDNGYDLIIVWEDDIFEMSVKRIVQKCKELVCKNK